MAIDGVVLLNGYEAVVGVVDGIGVVDTGGVDDNEDVWDVVSIGEQRGAASRDGRLSWSCNVCAGVCDGIEASRRSTCHSVCGGVSGVRGVCMADNTKLGSGREGCKGVCRRGYHSTPSLFLTALLVAVDTGKSVLGQCCGFRYCPV